jgi:hypothetical protein
MCVKRTLLNEIRFIKFHTLFNNNLSRLKWGPRFQITFPGVPVLEDQFGVSQPGFFGHLGGLLDVEALGDEEGPVDLVQVLPRGGDVVEHAFLCRLGVVGEEH